MCARSESKCLEAVKEIKTILQNEKSTGSVEFMQLDLASLQSVKEFADTFKSRDLSLDLLILNAGVMMNPFQKTTDGFESQFGTNHIGHFLLTKLLMAQLLSSKGHVVM